MLLLVFGECHLMIVTIFTLQECVKDKALLSLMMARNVSKKEGMSIIAKVFPKCYNDLEPLGRRLRKGTRDDIRALQDAELFGYFQ